MAGKDPTVSRTPHAHPHAYPNYILGSKVRTPWVQPETKWKKCFAF